jgi:protein-S-isoprenylcysteine O-methyltransferase Ste14
MRKLRLKAIWLLVVPFLWLASPTPATLGIGAALAALGLLIRALSAGFIHKEKELTTSGPYAYTRNPLYLGTFFLGLGVTVAGGRWVFVAAFLVFFGLVYTKTIRNEARLMEELFGETYRHYAGRVPLFVPRLSPYRRAGESGGEPEFSLARWKRNREYEALLGAAAGFAFLALRMYWP